MHSVSLSQQTATTTTMNDDDDDAVRLQEANAELDVEAQARLWGLTLDFVKPLALKAAILLRIPDIIAAAGPHGSLSLQQIIDQLPTDTVKSNYLYRILRFLVAYEVFDEVSTVEAASGENEKRFRLTPLSRLLVKDSPICFSPMVLMLTDQVSQAPFHHLHETVLEGGYAFTKAHGKDIWELESENPAFNSLLNNAMAAGSKMSMRQIVQQYDGFQSVKSLVDVGGGLGESISQIVAAYPHIHGINYDMPHVIAIAPVIPGVEHIGGSMFENVPSADTIFMKNVLHDWDDDHCMTVLLNCHKVLPDDGKVIVVEMVLNPLSNEKAGLSIGLAGDLIMMAHSSGGKERREDEWQNLLNGSGFTIKRIVALQPGPRSLIEACKSC